MPQALRCAVCGAGTQDVKLCPDCVSDLRAELHDAAGLVPDGNGKGHHLASLGDDVEVTRSRQDQLAPAYQRWGGSHGDSPLPVKMGASAALRSLHSVLIYWAQQVNQHCPDRLATVTAARVILTFLHRLATSPHAGLAVTEITGAIHRARHAIDRPNDARVYLGPCDNSQCRRDVYSQPESELGRCIGCSAVYDVESRRRWLLDVAQDRLGTAVEVAGLLRTAGVDCSPAKLRGYAHRGTLPLVSRNAKGHPMYRVRDALAEVLRAEASKNARHPATQVTVSCE
jgi:hypothetical protein